MSGVTIHQVAEAAGVSASTVSNVLNGRTDRMQPATLARVERAIDQLSYRPNRAARMLRTGRIKVIGLIVPSVANPFWGALARELESIALAEGYHVLLCNSERDPARELKYGEELLADGVSGVVLCSSLPSLDHVAPLLSRGLKMVAFDRTAQAGDPPSLASISVDNAMGAELATRHLIELGHRRLAFVSGSVNSVNRRERLRGFRAALESAGLDPADAVVWPGADTTEFSDKDAAELGRKAARELLSGPRPPTAFVAINDMCAIGICRGAKDAGRSAGQDVSVVGFDDILLADLFEPPLTTVRQPLPEMAAETFQQLRARIDSAPVAGRSLLIRPRLVVRESTAPAQAPVPAPAGASVPASTEAGQPLVG
ncbi:LacI family transcriptional regulator [Streptomyces sp. NBC_00121]|uniref:LacI family DNA-binding transcriptional regulator n=1 Tax=unclassified Streptomyces TaxID=2593676 RepID=UPI0028C48868|nr:MULTISPECIES: LacI family DNA-binding transcriptional regulator [unclassified Streptomyces]WNO62800.1 LacI family DNA-binding transcriptional regulator [Streptomyces sp. AM2-3-1]WSC67382.1 LacI family transcriptional regulator [Streptomyces sp. NBC_01760]WTI85266.1 LacI family transcriptional regulator [Streptomyces sp. NBC_00724]